MSDIKLEVGKTYRNRQGKYHKIVSFDPSEERYQYSDSDGYSYTEAGRFDAAKKTLFDLIEKVTSPKAQVIPFLKPAEVEAKCSFCATPKSQTKSLIQSGSNSHCICDKCIAQAKLRIEETKEST